ncbi:hypothetical protein [Myxococcus sp. AB056]|uniref:hypothetical protein n=1 Tax=Myxococcus sp. AB056 TaxID=2562792 RepID=UPI001E307BD6|nr:hypothetical protein [Myxococcus sp. AB056]
MKKLLITVTGGLAFLLAPTEARACAYDSAGPVFVTSSHPDWPLSTFAAGRLGVVHGSMRSAYLAFAYRTMMGIPTTPEEQQPLVTRWELMHQALPEHLSLTPGFQRWLAVRKQVAPQLPEASPEHSRQVQYAQVPRIQGDAFQRAANTATDLAQAWKKHPALVEEWMRNQDIVFGPCAILPEPDPRLDEGVSAQQQARRRDERAYQEAASRFYCDDYPGALSSFQKLAASQESPYRALAAYLVARTHVRQALMEKKGEYHFESREDAVFLSRLSEADQVIDGVLASPELRSVHAPARGLRSLVRYRLRPKTWHCELLSHVLEPGTGTALASGAGRPRPDVAGSEHLRGPPRARRGAPGVAPRHEGLALQRGARCGAPRAIRRSPGPLEEDGAHTVARRRAEQGDAGRSRRAGAARRLREGRALVSRRPDGGVPCRAALAWPRRGGGGAGAARDGARRADPGPSLHGQPAARGAARGGQRPGRGHAGSRQHHRRL